MYRVAARTVCFVAGLAMLLLVTEGGSAGRTQLRPTATAPRITFAPAPFVELGALDGVTGSGDGDDDDDDDDETDIQQIMDDIIDSYNGDGLLSHNFASGWTLLGHFSEEEDRGNTNLYGWGRSSTIDWRNEENKNELFGSDCMAKKAHGTRGCTAWALLRHDLLNLLYNSGSVTHPVGIIVDFNSPEVRKPKLMLKLASVLDFASWDRYPNLVSEDDQMWKNKPPGGEASAQNTLKNEVAKCKATFPAATTGLAEPNLAANGGPDLTAFRETPCAPFVAKYQCDPSAKPLVTPDGKEHRTYYDSSTQPHRYVAAVGERGQYHWEALYGQATELPWNVNDLQCPFLPDINGHFSSATMKAYTGAIKLTYAKLQQAYANDPPESLLKANPNFDDLQKANLQEWARFQKMYLDTELDIFSRPSNNKDWKSYNPLGEGSDDLVYKAMRAVTMSDATCLDLYHSQYICDYWMKNGYLPQQHGNDVPESTVLETVRTAACKLSFQLSYEAKRWVPVVRVKAFIGLPLNVAAWQDRTRLEGKNFIQYFDCCTQNDWYIDAAKNSYTRCK